jgi:hypothetical protein
MRHKGVPTGAENARTKVPINPSVRGTEEQAEREDKGVTEPSYRHEGSGNPGGHGRGGKHRK